MASAETRLALAGALGIDVSSLTTNKPPTTRLSRGLRIGLVCGSLGWIVGGICSVAGAYSAGLSGAEAGFTYGGLGIFLGLTGASLGAIVNRHLKSLAVTPNDELSSMSDNLASIDESKATLRFRAGRYDLERAANILSLV